MARTKSIEEGDVSENVVESEKTDPEKIVYVADIEEVWHPMGNKYIVHRNSGNELILVTPNGCGVRIATPEKYKDAKKGDVIYI